MKKLGQAKLLLRTVVTAALMTILVVPLLVNEAGLQSGKVAGGVLSGAVPVASRSHSAVNHSAVAASPCGAGSSGQALPVGDIPGWHQVLTDDFNSSTLDTSKWFAYDGKPGGAPLAWWSRSNVVVNNCLATIRGTKDPRTGGYLTSGIGMYHTQTYGKYLVRMRADAGNGISVIALLWPASGAWPPEVDFYEDAGGPRSYTSTALHCSDGCAIQKFLYNYDFTKWHTVGVEWTPGKLTYTMDGAVWATLSDGGVPSIPMWMGIQSQALTCTQWNTCLDSSTPNEVDTQVAWAAVYTPTS